MTWTNIPTAVFNKKLTKFNLSAYGLQNKAQTNNMKLIDKIMRLITIPLKVMSAIAVAILPINTAI